jgi:hypothetical protein
MKTSTERSQDLRQRRREAGLFEVRGIWAKPEKHAEIRQEAKKILKANSGT